MAGGGSERPCYYAVLGVARDAPAADIRAAYRRQALRLHPDKLQLREGSRENKAAQARFHLLQEAYEVLSDTSRRAFYDANARRRQSESDLIKSLRSMDNAFERMRQAMNRLNQQVRRNVAMDDDELRAIIEEITKDNNLPRTTPVSVWSQMHNGSSSSPTSSSCSDARTGGAAAGPQASAAAAASNAGENSKQGAGASSSTPASPRGTKRPPSPGVRQPVRP